MTRRSILFASAAATPGVAVIAARVSAQPPAVPVIVRLPTTDGPGEIREFRADAYATDLWVLYRGGAVRESAQVYVQRLRASTRGTA